jgi:hypothetical protein
MGPRRGRTEDGMATQAQEAVRDAGRSGELWQHWQYARERGGISEGSGERGKLRRQIAEQAAVAAYEATGKRSVERMGTEQWAKTWDYDYAAAAARGSR